MRSLWRPWSRDTVRIVSDGVRGAVFYGYSQWPSYSYFLFMGHEEF